MSSAVSQHYWDTLYDNYDTTYDPDGVLFKDLFDRFLTREGTCFEVGCYPGNFLVYLSRRFGYTVSGIDATPYVLTRLPDHLVRHAARVGQFYHGDFLCFQ